MTACHLCGADTTSKKMCPSCAAPVIYIPKPKRELELPIKRRIRAALTDRGVLCWEHIVDNRNFSTGLGLGTSDLICVVPPQGRFLGIEIKRPGYVPSDVTQAQRSWLAVVRQFGGMSGIATNVTEALALVELAQAMSKLHVDAPQL